MILIGKIIGVHGIKGELKVIPYTDNPERFRLLKSVYIKTENNLVFLNILNYRYHKNLVLLTLENIEDRNIAEKYRNSEIYIDKDLRLKLPDNRFYIDELIGLNVYENDIYLGNIIDVLQPGANDVYVINRNNNKKGYIPAIKQVVLKVDLKNNRMNVKLPLNLFDEV